MCALLLNLEPGDEVIVPSFTFVSSANAFYLHGAKPVFVDIREDTLNLDERLLADAITERTKAIVVVHYAGIACEMEAISRIAEEAGVVVIEDNAHGLFASYKGKPLGTWSALATQSFHETKNFSCGEGGALLINDAEMAVRAEIIREKGTNRSRFFRGEIDKYTWVDVGSSYLSADPLAAILLAQLEARETIQARRAAIWNRYDDELADWAREQDVSTPHVPADCEQSFHMYWMLLPSSEARASFIAHMKENGVHVVFHYLPLHLSDMGRSLGGAEGQCPVTEDIAHRLVRLPLFLGLEDTQQDRVIEVARAWRLA
jgi:dTDP-4-amino-4,6-dideoxygalactose transaminase